MTGENDGAPRRWQRAGERAVQRLPADPGAASRHLVRGCERIQEGRLEALFCMDGRDGGLRPLAMAVRRHLRLPLPELRDCRRCACGAAVSAHGDHADCCRLLSALRTYRHNELRDAGVLAPCKQVGLPAYREEPHIVDGTADRPADALIIGLELEEVLGVYRRWRLPECIRETACASEFRLSSAAFERRGVKLLGAPIGTDEFAEALLAKRVKQIEEEGGILGQMACEPANAHPPGCQRVSNTARTPRRANVFLTRRAAEC